MSSREIRKASPAWPAPKLKVVARSIVHGQIAIVVLYCSCNPWIVFARILIVSPGIGKTPGSVNAGVRDCRFY